MEGIPNRCGGIFGEVGFLLITCLFAVLCGACCVFCCALLLGFGVDDALGFLGSWVRVGVGFVLFVRLCEGVRACCALLLSRLLGSIERWLISRCWNVCSVNVPCARGSP